MSIADDLLLQLRPFAGQTFVPAKVFSAASGTGLEIAAYAVGIESMGCSLEELRLTAPFLAGAGMDVLTKWANSLCQRITYLMENLGPLEFDVQASEVLIRSMPPAVKPGTTKYYEVLLSSLGSGQFSLKRYESQVGATVSRQPISLDVTYEQLVKLVEDLEATVPAGP